MRAIFEEKTNLNIDQIILISDERAHHLNVVRAKINEQILLLDGAGTKALGVIQNISKKEIQIKVIKVEEHQFSAKKYLFLGVPKKDAFEDIVKIATECGISDIVPLSTKYSQYEYEENERINKIIENAMIQSNNLFKPKIHQQQKLNDFLVGHELSLSRTFLFTSFGENKLAKEKCKLEAWGVFIGPEAGFDTEEESSILSSKYAPIGIHLPIPIMRAPTAVAVSVGYILGNYEI